MHTFGLNDQLLICNFILYFDQHSESDKKNYLILIYSNMTYDNFRYFDVGCIVDSYLLRLLGRDRKVVQSVRFHCIFLFRTLDIVIVHIQKTRKKYICLHIIFFLLFTFNQQIVYCWNKSKYKKVSQVNNKKTNLMRKLYWIKRK